MNASKPEAAMCQISERALIQQAIRETLSTAAYGYYYRPGCTQRDIVASLFGVSLEDATRICWKYGFHPDKMMPHPLGGC